MNWQPDEIKALRKKLPLSQKQFAERLGVKRQTVACWETGRRTPSEKIIAILKKLETQIGAQEIPSGQEIKELRQKLGLSQRQFANRLGVSQNLIWYWETGKKSPSKDWEEKIALLAKKENADNQNVDNQNVDNQNVDNQNVDKESVAQVVNQEESVASEDVASENVTEENVTDQNVTSEEGEQNVTSEEGEQIMTSEEGEQIMTSEEGEQNVTSEEGGQAENIAHLNCKEAALEYLSYGWSVIPLCPPDCSPDKVPWHWRKDGKPCECVNKGKVPLVAWTVYQERLPTESEVEQWFSKWPFANVGIVTGRVSKLLVVDFDSREAIDAINSFGGFPKTPEVKTGGSGQHNYFQHPSEGIIKNFAGKLQSVHPNLEKVDFRADGGQVVAPPSLHVSGNRYVWTVPPNEVSPPDLPKWFFDLLEQKPTECGMRNAECGIKNRSSIPKSEFRIPNSSLPDNFEVLKKCDSLIKSLWSNESLQVSKKGGPERSDYDWALGRACIERGIRNRDDLATILAHFPHGKYARDSSETNLALTVEKLISTVPHLSKENAEEVLLSLRKQLNTIIPELNEREVLVVRATPGLGKTTEIIEVIRNSDRRIILAEPTKEMARNVFLQFSREGVSQASHADDTSLLKGRDSTCCMRYSQVQAIAAKGYMPGKVICPSCPYSPDKLFSSCCEYFRQFFNPTRVKVTTYEQALELHFAGKLNADLLVLDEDPSRALFKKVEITANQLHFKKDSKYPLPTFGRLIRDTLHEAEEKAAGQTQAFRCIKIVSLLNSVAKKRRIKLTKHLRLVSECIENVFDQPARLESLTEEEMEALPHAYVGFLASSLLSEIDKAQNPPNPRMRGQGGDIGKFDTATPADWNSRLTLVVSGGRARYIMREVRKITVRTPIVVLDAYANKDYYSKLLGRDVKFLLFDAQSHCEVMTIPLNTSKKAFFLRKENLFDDLAAVVKINPNRKILVYTYLFLTEDVKKMFPFVAVEHFWSGRGKDCWRDYDVVIIFGTPEPNPSELFDDARALYADDENPISLAQSESDPRKYADSRLQLLREMRREDEIMQDVHRIRPIWGKGLSKKVVVLSQLYCPQLPPDKIIDPQTLDKKSAARELRKERLIKLIEACIKEYGFYFEEFAVAAGLIKTTGGCVCVHAGGGVGDGMDTGFCKPSYKNILIRGFTETSNDAGSANYGGNNKEYIANRDAILAELGLSPARMSVHQDGVWRPYKIWGNLDAAKAFFAEIENREREEEKARREYSEEVRREFDEEFSQYKE